MMLDIQLPFDGGYLKTLQTKDVHEGYEIGRAHV